MSLPYGSALCDGVPWPVNPAKSVVICRDCLRRLTVPDHPWQKFLNPPPAKHDGKTWACTKRIEK